MLGVLTQAQLGDDPVDLTEGVVDGPFRAGTDYMSVRVVLAGSAGNNDE